MKSIHSNISVSTIGRKSSITYSQDFLGMPLLPMLKLGILLKLGW